MTNINIYNNCPFDIEYVHLTHFTSQTQRDNFLNGYISWVATDFKVITNYVIVPFNRDYLDGCNYIDFTRGNFRQFAFVTNLEHINEVSTKITFEIDYWQTYLFNIDFGNAYVERGHGNYYNKNLLPDYYVNANVILNEFKLFNHGGSDMIFIYMIWLDEEDTFVDSQSNIENCSVLFTPYRKSTVGALPSYYEGISGVPTNILHKFLSSPRCKGAYTSHYGSSSGGKSITFDNGETSYIWGYSESNGKIRWDIPKITNGSRWDKLNCYPYSYTKIKNATGEIILENENLPDLLDISVQQFAGNTQSMVCKCENMINNGNTFYGKSLVDNRQNVLSIVKNDLDNYLYNNANSINNAMSQNTQRYELNTTNNVLSMISGQQTSFQYNPDSSNPYNGLILDTAKNISRGLMSEVGNMNSYYNFQNTEKAYQVDLKNSPDNIMGMSGNGSACACYDNLNYFSIQSWGLDESNLQKMETYFDTYGYPIEKVINVKSCFTSNNGYNYIKTNNLCVHVNNQIAKKIINNAFNRGVWIYHNNADYSNFYNQGGGY